MNLRDDLHVVDFPVLLSIRTGDIFIVEKWDDKLDPSKSVYAVALFEAPNLERLNVPLSEVAKRTGVVCAGITKDGWGWIPLEGNTKDYIGNLLEEVKARPDEWFKLTITYESPLK